MVKNIVGPRGSGKTKELVEYAAEHGCTIVCGDVDRMLQKIHGYGKAGLRVINYLEFWAIEDAVDTNGYCIDEIESFCETIGIKAFTLVG